MHVHPTVSELVTANHILAHEGVVDAFGHVSTRHPDRPGRYLLARSCSPALVKPEDLMEFDFEGNTVRNDDRTAYLERYIHAAIYRERPDVGAVVHSHAPELIPFGVTGNPVRPLIHTAGSIGTSVPIWDISDTFGDTSLLVTSMSIAQDLATSLSQHTALLMRGHGAVIVGKSIRDAVLTAIYLQVNASLDLQSRRLGKVKYLSAGEIALSHPNLLGPNASARAWDYFAHRAAASQARSYSGETNVGPGR